MPIPAQDIADRIRFALDAEGADYYDDDRDIIPAINTAIHWLIGIVNLELGRSKFGEELFRDLTKSRVFRTNKDSRLSMDAFPDEVWSILSVYPKPTTGQRSPTSPPPSGTELASFERVDLYHISSDFSAKRLTVEEWAFNKSNPFEAGYDGVALCDDIKEYAYIDPIDYNWNNDETAGGLIKEIEIRPALDKKLVSVIYVKKPDDINVIGDSVEFPSSAFTVIFNKALQYIAYKQGDNTTIDIMATKDLVNIVKTIL